MNLTVKDQVDAVTYRLTGQTIKWALVRHPGKIIVSPRQSGKTTQLLEFCIEHYPGGVILWLMDQSAAILVKERAPAEFFFESTIVWGNGQPNINGIDQPIFADEILLFGGFTARTIIRDRRFRGAVSSESALGVGDGLGPLCIQC